MSDCLFDDCSGCSCHISPPCGHCVDHTCEHQDGGICENCYELRTGDWPKRLTVTIGATKDRMGDLGEQIGLTGDAFALFCHALTEVKCTIEVDETGEARLIEASDR